MELASVVKNKRGDFTDMFVFLVLVFIFAIGLFIFSFVIPEIADGLTDANLNTTQEGTEAIFQLRQLGSQGIQNGFFLLFIGLIISTFISSFLSNAHPIFFFVYLFMLGLTILVGSYLGNAYQQMAEIPIFAEQLSEQTLINVVMDNYLMVLLGVGALSMFITFAKFSGVFARGGGDQL